MVTQPDNWKFHTTHFRTSFILTVVAQWNMSACKFANLHEVKFSGGDNSSEKVSLVTNPLCYLQPVKYEGCAVLTLAQLHFRCTPSAPSAPSMFFSETVASLTSSPLPVAHAPRNSTRPAMAEGPALHTMHRWVPCACHFRILTIVFAVRG